MANLEIVKGNGEKPSDHALEDKHRDIPEPVPRTALDVKVIITLSDLVAMMCIDLHTNRPLKADVSVDLLPLSNARLELPRVIAKSDPCLFFYQDETNEWVVMQQRIEYAKTPFNDYPSWLVRWRHTVEKLVKDSHFVFKVSDKVDNPTLRTVPLTSLGFDGSLMSIKKKEVQDDKRELFKICEPVGIPSSDFEELTVFTPPQISRTVIAVEACVFQPVRDLIVWLEDYTRRKNLRSDHNVTLLSPDPDAKYARHPHPKKLGTFLTALFLTT